MEDNMAVTIKRFEDILKTELAAMCTEFTSHMTTIQNMCSKVDFLIGEQREQKKVINKHTGRLDALEQQVTDLQDRSRRSNLRLQEAHTIACMNTMVGNSKMAFLSVYAPCSPDPTFFFF